MEVELDKKKLQFTNDEGEKVNVDVDQDQTEKDEEVFESNHYSNLAEELDETEINLLGKELTRAVANAVFKCCAQVGVRCICIQ